MADEPRIHFTQVGIASTPSNGKASVASAQAAIAASASSVLSVATATSAQATNYSVGDAVVRGAQVAIAITRRAPFSGPRASFIFAGG